jgi:hypothetical protein
MYGILLSVGVGFLMHSKVKVSILPQSNSTNKIFFGILQGLENETKWNETKRKKRKIFRNEMKRNGKKLQNQETKRNETESHRK